MNCALAGKQASLQAYYAETWFTQEGARLKARRLKQAGFPDTTNWRFITLTLAGRKIAPQEAYLQGKGRLRRFLVRLRRAVGQAFKWCWKLEFHEDGFPHWHLLIEYRKPIPEEILEQLERWWGFGRANVKRVRQKDIEYLFKYVAKGPDDLPEWVLFYEGRIRAFQTSAGFYTGKKPKSREKKKPMKCVLPVSLKTRMGWDEKKALLVEEKPDGSRRLSVVKLKMTFNALLLARARQAMQRRIPLAEPCIVTISQLQAEEITYESRKWAGLAGIPQCADNAAAV